MYPNSYKKPVQILYILHDEDNELADFQGNITAQRFKDFNKNTIAGGL